MRALLLGAIARPACSRGARVPFVYRTRPCNCAQCRLEAARNRRMLSGSCAPAAPPLHVGPTANGLCCAHTPPAAGLLQRRRMPLLRRCTTIVRAQAVPATARGRQAARDPGPASPACSSGGPFWTTIAPAACTCPSQSEPAAWQTPRVAPGPDRTQRPGGRAERTRQPSADMHAGIKRPRSRSRVSP